MRVRLQQMKACIQSYGRSFTSIPGLLWVKGLALFLTPCGLVLVFQMFRPLHIVHIDMEEVMTQYAFFHAKATPTLDEEHSLKQAEAFKRCVVNIAQKKRWIMTDRRGCWGDSKTLAALPDVTALIRKRCGGGS